MELYRQQQIRVQIKGILDNLKQNEEIDFNEQMDISTYASDEFWNKYTQIRSTHKRQKEIETKDEARKNVPVHNDYSTTVIGSKNKVATHGSKINEDDSEMKELAKEANILSTRNIVVGSIAIIAAIAIGLWQKGC